MSDRSIVLLGSSRRPAAVRRLSPAQALSALTRAALTDPSVPATQATLDRVAEVALTTAVYVEVEGGAGLASALAGRPAEAADRGAPPSELDGVPLVEAFWRRAEGVTVTWNLDTAPEHPVFSRRGAATWTGDRGLVRMLADLSSWRRVPSLVDSSGLSFGEVTGALAHLAEGGLAWFADFEPDRTLPGGLVDLDREVGPLALRPTWSAGPLFVGARGQAPRALPFMPRLGEMEGRWVAGVELDAHRRGRQVGRVRLHGGRLTGEALRRLVPLLDGTRDRDQVVGALPGPLRERGARALRAMADVGALEARSLERVRPPDPCATWLGHAAVIVSFGDRHLWVDPLTTASQHQGRPEHAPPDRRTLPYPTAILVTHGDNDHLNPGTLLCIDPSTPVLVPSQAGVGPWQVDTVGLLRALGFDDVRPLDDWERVDLGGGVTVTAVPFEGEDWGLDQASVTWLVEGPVGEARRRIYLSADSSGMLPHAQRIRGDRGIDLAFLGVSGNVEAHVMTPGFGYGSFYEAFIPPTRHARFVRHTDGPREAAALAGALGARRAFGYAAGGTPYFDMAYSDEGDHVAFVDALRTEAPDCLSVDLTPGEPQPL